jgi:hypothetical protein
MYDLDFAYAQARIQARFAALPRETDWQRVAASRTLAAFLEDARTGSLREWVKGFSVQSDVHDLEAGIGSLYRDALEAITALAPSPGARPCPGFAGCRCSLCWPTCRPAA